MSICGRCKKEKQDMKSPSICSDCAEIRKRYYEKNTEQYKNTQRAWRIKNRERFNQLQKEWRDKNPDKIKVTKRKQATLPTTRFRYAIKQAAKRNIPFNLTLEEFSEIIKCECAYCNGRFGKVTTGSGLDRIDNSKGYIISNVCSCCNICNRIKSDLFTFEETKAAVNAILAIRYQSS